MNEKVEQLPPLPPLRQKDREPKTFPIRVPGETGLYQDFRRREEEESYIGKIEDFFPLEEGKDWVKLRWSRSGFRKHGGFNWYYVTFKATIERDGEEIEIDRFGWFGTKRRTKEQKKKGKPLQFLVKGDKFIQGPEPTKRKPRKKKTPTGQYILPMPTERK